MDKFTYTRNGMYTYIYYTSLDTFMGANPPCKECLVKTMYIEDISDLLDEFVGLQIKSYSLLKEFIRKEQKNLIIYKKGI